MAPIYAVTTLSFSIVVVVDTSLQLDIAESNSVDLLTHDHGAWLEHERRSNYKTIHYGFHIRMSHVRIEDRGCQEI